MHPDCKWTQDLFEVMKMVKTDFVVMVEELCKVTEKSVMCPLKWLNVMAVKLYLLSHVGVEKHRLYVPGLLGVKSRLHYLPLCHQVIQLICALAFC